jgi:hypothetical protein
MQGATKRAHCQRTALASTLKSEQWEEERRVVEGELERVQHAQSRIAAAGEKL